MSHRRRAGGWAGPSACTGRSASHFFWRKTCLFDWNIFIQCSGFSMKMYHFIFNMMIASLFLLLQSWAAKWRQAMNMRAGQDQSQSLWEGATLCPLATQGGTGSKWRHLGQKLNGKENQSMQLEQREKCAGKGGQEPRVRLQSFNEKEYFSCKCAHLFLFPNVKLKAEGTQQGGTADGSRVPVLCRLTPKHLDLSKPAENQYWAGQKCLALLLLFSRLSSAGISEAPGFQACIHFPLAFPDGLWEQQRC